MELLSCYRQFKYMENIFNAKDIRDKLKTEHDDFRGVINQYSEILKEIKVEHQGNIYS